MFKSLAAAGLAALSIAILSPAAKADVDVFLRFGVPNVDYYDDDYVHYNNRIYEDGSCGYGSRRFDCPDFYAGPRERRHRLHRRYHDEDFGRVSCAEAKGIVREHGFHHVVATDCDGKHYHFKARKDGDRFFVRVSSRSGYLTFYYR